MATYREVSKRNNGRYEREAVENLALAYRETHNEMARRRPCGDNGPCVVAPVSGAL